MACLSNWSTAEAKTDPLYKWSLPNLPEVKEHGRLNPEDTFHYTSFVHDALVRSGHEMLEQLKKHPKWQQFAKAFAAAVNGDPKLDQYLADAGVDVSALSAARRETTLYPRAYSLKYLRHLNDENIAWILAEGHHEQVAPNMNNSFLLLNRTSIGLIGPAILELVVTEDQWRQMPDTQRETHVRLSDLDVRDMADLIELVSSRSMEESILNVAPTLTLF